MARFKFLIVATATLSCPVSQAQYRGELVQQLQEVIPPETITNAERLRTNGFTIESSQVRNLGPGFVLEDGQFQLLTITGDEMFKVAVEQGRSGSQGGGVGVFHRDSGIPMLSFGDQDGDGRIDFLEYNVLDENGDRSTLIIDYEADGQADLRAYFQAGYIEIWHLGEWYRVEERNGNRYISVGGEAVQLEMQDNRWVVP